MHSESLADVPFGGDERTHFLNETLENLTEIYKGVSTQ